MGFFVTKIQSENWTRVFSEYAHLATFGVQRNRELERIDFSLLALDDKNSPAGFITCKEMDAETLYWQYGGVFPNYQKSLHVIEGYREFLSWSRQRYKRVTTRIENENITMLKMALMVGFRIMGVHLFDKKIFVELNIEFQGG